MRNLDRNASAVAGSVDPKGLVAPLPPPVRPVAASTVPGQAQLAAIHAYLGKHPGGSGHLAYQKESRECTAPATMRIADRKSTRVNSSHANISYAVFCLK